MMMFSVVASFVALGSVAAILRRDRLSLGIPVAYLASLLLIHVPGAVAHLLDKRGVLAYGRPFTAIGIGLAALGSCFFAVGVWLATRRHETPIAGPANRTLFPRFCFIAGAGAAIIAVLLSIPSVEAVIERGALIWMLGVILGLRLANVQRNTLQAAKWVAVLMIYPVLMLLLGGFISYGIGAMITVLSVLVVSAKSSIRVVLGCVLASILGMSVFVAYFENREAIRGAVWGGEAVGRRVDVSVTAASDIALFDPSQDRHLQALAARLNQNYFVGLAAARIESGESSYLRGRTIWEGFLSIIPRALWPDKPMAAGSGRIVADMTGLMLSRGTSFGVGNVMEFHINFGITGVVVGFLLLGFCLARLDRLAAVAYVRGDLGMTPVYFLPAVAMIQPNGSMVEMVGGAAAALIAAFGWRWAWERWPKPGADLPILAGHANRSAA